MRYILVTTLMLALTLGAIPAHARKQHKYDTGVVSFINNNQVAMNNVTYTLRPDVKVVRIVKESNGSRYERKGSLSDVSIGKRVYLKVLGRTAYEIVVER